jgi:hypothetical protein
MTVEREREAELTLLLLLEDMPVEDRVPFLQEHGISRAEFERVYEKWYRVLEAYRKDKQEKESSND